MSLRTQRHRLRHSVTTPVSCLVQYRRLVSGLHVATSESLNPLLRLEILLFSGGPGGSRSINTQESRREHHGDLGALILISLHHKELDKNF